MDKGPDMNFDNLKDIFQKMKEKNEGKGPKNAKRVNGAKANFKEAFGKVRENLNKKDNNRKGLSTIIIILLTLVVMLICFFFMLPALNPMAPEFYSFLILTIIVFNLLNMFLGSAPLMKTIIPGAALALILFLIPSILTFFSIPLFRSRAYSRLITVENAEFKDTVSKISVDKIPVVDRDAAQMLGDKEMGSIPELVSQFDIDDNFTQINITGNPMRVSPLKYNDIFKYFSNMGTGLQYYVKVNMANQKAELVKLNDPMKFTKSDILFRNLKRKIRFQYPFAMLGDSNFEVNDEGRAYYTTPILTKRITFMSGLDVAGVIVTDAATGESVKYNISDIPEWVDRVYPSNIIINQLDLKGKYSGGFFNSIFGQKNVTRTTEGYNYIPMDNDVYLFTGVTSVMKDSSNIGFYFVNLRTKEAKFFSVPSADEISAMKSAEGAVKEKGYGSTFPILLNIQDKPVYLMSLKDNTKTAKMYALVDAEQFTNVSTGTTVAEALNKFNVSFNPTDKATESSIEKDITIDEIKEVVIDGNTVIFIKASGDEKIYIGTSKQLGYKSAFIKKGDTIKIFGNDRDSQFDILEIR